MAKKSKIFTDKDKNKFKVVYEMNANKKISCTLWKNYGKKYEFSHEDYSLFKDDKKIIGSKFFKELQNIINLVKSVECFK